MLQLFLEPLGHVVGSAKSKELLLRAASSGEQQSRLQVLGMALGVSEWLKSFEQRLTPDAKQLVKLELAPELTAMGGQVRVTSSANCVVSSSTKTRMCNEY